MISLLGHLIIATGAPTEESKRAEVFNWRDQTNVNCSAVPDFPIEIYGGVAGVINGTEYMCGGYYSDQCFNIITGEPAPFDLIDERALAVSANSNNKLFIFGGLYR